MSIFKIALAKEKDYSCSFWGEGGGLILIQNRPHHLINLATGGIPHVVTGPKLSGSRNAAVSGPAEMLMCAVCTYNYKTWPGLCQC